MANPIRFSEIFDFTSDKDVRDALALIKNLDKVYTKLINNAKKLAPEYAKQNKIIATSVLELNKVVSGLNPILEKDQKQLAAASKSMDIMSAASEGLTKKTATLGTTVKSLESEQKKFNKAASETIKLDKEQERLKAKLASLDTKQAAETAKLRAQITQKNKELRRSAQESLKLVSIYDREVNALKILTQRYKDAAIQYGINSKQARALKVELDKLRESITKVNRATGNFSDNVGNYPKRFALAAGGVRQLAAALGFTGVIFALVAAFRNAFNTIRSFQKENAVLAGVLNKTRKEISDLTKDAERLGATTAKSASEVTQLQIAYARLGFTQQEILNLTGDTINGSIALNASLAETAELTGAVIRTFDDLETTDADVVLDQMTAATQRSALNFEKLQTGLPIVAGAANAAGVSFTRLLALLGKLSDAGIDASMSSTALRNIFIESASKGLSYEQILTKIGNSQDKLTASTDQFGKRAAVSGTILSNLTKEVGDLDSTLQASGGTAEKVAKGQLDTLDGEIILLTSAWEGFILSIESGDGVIAQFVRTTLSSLTSALQKLSETAESMSSKVFDELIRRGYTADQVIEDIGNGTLRFNDAIEKQVLLLANQKRVFDLETEAIEIYEIAIKDGITTSEDFLKVQSQYINQYREEADITTQLNKIKSLFNKENDDTVKGVEELNKAQMNQINLFREFVDENRGFDTKLSREEIQKLSDAIKDMDTEFFEKFTFEDLVDSKTTVDGLKPIGEAIEANLDKPMVAAEKRGKEVTNKLAFYWKQFAEQIQLALTTAFESASIALNQFFTNQDIRRENSFVKFEDQRQSEIDALEAKREKELENENLTTESKKAINKKYADAIGAIEGQIEDKRRQAQIQQAKAAKKQAIFNILLNTAQGVTAALTSIPPNVPLSIAIGIIGGVQLAAAASQPLPVFAKGTDNAPGGLAVVGDGGKRELVMEPSGRTYLTSDRPEIRNIPKGSKVFPDADLVDREFGSTIMRNITAGQAFDREIDNHNASVNKLQSVLNQERLNNDQFRKTLTATLEKENDYMVNKFISGLHSLPLNNWSFTDKGQVTRSVQKGNTIRKNVELENKY